MADHFSFDIPKQHKSIIKVIGVGGGGSNAVNHMYNQGIKDVEFIVCNTDMQALKSSPVPNKIQIGAHLTEGLGAGANPEKGRLAAQESKEEIRELLSNGTKMVFITAGMGGGTGTGAAPIIAEVCKDLGILTVGIVTKPFGFEGKKKKNYAEEGIEAIKSNCDTVLVILNDKLREISGNLAIRDAFAQADNVLTNAAKSIAEIITVTSDINVDFEDVKTVMSNSGAAVMGSSTTGGENRARRAAEEALSSPLLNSTDILGAKKILLSIRFGETAELTMDELTEITDYIEEKAGDEAEVIFGQGLDVTLDDKVCVTVIATGFDEVAVEREEEELSFITKRKVIDMDSGLEIPKEEKIERPVEPTHFEEEQAEAQEESRKIDWDDDKYFLTEEEMQQQRQEEDEAMHWQIKQGSLPFDEGRVNRPMNRPVSNPETEKGPSKDRLIRQALERRQSLEEKSLQGQNGLDQEEFKDRLERPAYERKQVEFKPVPKSSDRRISRYNLNDDNELLGDNKFLHDNVD